MPASCRSRLRRVTPLPPSAGSRFRRIKPKQAHLRPSGAGPRAMAIRDRALAALLCIMHALFCSGRKADRWWAAEILPGALRSRHPVSGRGARADSSSPEERLELRPWPRVQNVPGFKPATVVHTEAHRVGRGMADGSAGHCRVRARKVASAREKIRSSTGQAGSMILRTTRDAA